VIVNGRRVGLMALYHDISELLAARREALAAQSAEAGLVSWNLARERARTALASLPSH